MKDSTPREVVALSPLSRRQKRYYHNRIVVGLTGLVDALVPEGDSDEAKEMREVAKEVKEQIIRECIV